MRISVAERGFTIVELLVVVAIIALLVGILLPAIGKARDASLVTTSQSNLRQIGSAWSAYATEYGDRQMTFINDNMSRYGGGAAAPDATTVCQNYTSANGQPHPPIIIGYATNPTNPSAMYPYSAIFEGTAGNMAAALVRAQPIVFQGTGQRLGTFRCINFRAFSIYFSGRFYDRVFYAPKDRGVMASVEKYFDAPEEAQYIVGATGTMHFWSSYSLSPAAMYDPSVLSEQLGNTSSMAPMFNNPWQTPAGFKSPALSQARFGNLKTLAIEHHWLQNNKRGHCNPVWTATSATYDGCEPWYFNCSLQSNPMCVFYDGHVDGVGVRDSMDSNQRVLAQHGQSTSNGVKGLWSRNTPFGGLYEPAAGAWPANQWGYWQNAHSGDGAATCFHILTTYGIKGRDVVPR